MVAIGGGTPMIYNGKLEVLVIVNYKRKHSLCGEDSTHSRRRRDVGITLSDLDLALSQGTLKQLLESSDL